jgi:RND family efflux transporter MFP subunit
LNLTKHSMSRPLALVAIVLLLVAGGAVRAQENTIVGVDAVAYEAKSQTVPVIGRLVARESGVVAARIYGPVAEMRVEVGDRVAKGDVIALLVTTRLKAQTHLLAAEVEANKSLIAVAEADLGLARQQLERLEGLRESAAFSKGRYDDAQQNVARAHATLSEARARLERAEADLKIAEIDLKNTRVLAPYGGVVTVRHTAPGAYLNVGDDVVSLVNDTDIEIEADVPADRVRALASGVVIEFAFADGSRRRASVRAVVPEENPLTRTRRVRFTPGFDASAMNLAVNESVTLFVPIGAGEDVLTVHKDAVIHRDEKTWVFVVDGEGSALLHEVTLGDAIGGRFQVTSGVEPGSLVVVRGNERLFPGQKVTYER